MRNCVEIQGASTKSAHWTRCALPLLAGLVFASNAFAAPCFSVDGTKVSVNQLFAGDVKAQTVDLEDMPSVSTMASRGSEGHNMIFMNIKRDAAKKNVTSFSAKIDDKNYEFPKDACSKK
jgi:hypothetical protein